jgi:beta-glucanase (GH16 family)
MSRFLIVVLFAILMQSSVFAGAADLRAKRLGNGVNLTLLDQYWKGTKEKHFADHLKEKDLAPREGMLRDIAASGYKTVRIPVCFSAWATLEKPFRWETTDGLKATDTMLKWALENDLNVIIDMHHAELDGSFPNAAKTDRLVWLWQQVAKRYKNTDPERVLFELRNEPHDVKADDWREQANRLIKTVRAIAPMHTLIVGFHDWNSRAALVGSKPFEDNNLIYTFHYYDPFLFTHQSTTWSAEGLADIKDVPFPWNSKTKIKIPASAAGKWSGKLVGSYDKDSNPSKMNADLSAAKDWSLKFDVPIFVGEFGSFGKNTAIEDRCRHLEVVYGAFKDLGISNAAWEWDGGFNMFERGTSRLAGCVKNLITDSNSSKWKLEWSDEFNDKSGTGFDRTKWTANIGGKGWGNKEFQYYTDRIENVYHNGEGSLVIEARQESTNEGEKCWYGECKYTSARLVTENKFAQKYGRFEARIKVPFGQGIWPAFWMLGDDIGKVGWPKSGEIDIMENIGREPGILHGTIHGPGYSGAGGIGGATTLKNGERLTDQFHVYSIEWKENEIRWFLDGKLYFKLRSTNLPSEKKWVFDHPHFILLNLAVGGNWPGSPDKTTKFPQRLMIDYVRVYSSLEKKHK